MSPEPRSSINIRQEDRPISQPTAHKATLLLRVLNINDDFYSKGWERPISAELPNPGAASGLQQQHVCNYFSVLFFYLGENRQPPGNEVLPLSRCSTEILIWLLEQRMTATIETTSWGELGLQKGGKKASIMSKVKPGHFAIEFANHRKTLRCLAAYLQNVRPCSAKHGSKS